MAPLIGLPGRHSANSSAIRGKAVAAGASYVKAVNAGGGSLVIIPPFKTSSQSIQETVSRLDGVVLHGGIDIAPSLYGQSAHSEVTSFDESLDDFEMSFVSAAIGQEKPILAICRGMQVLNVYLGGSLYQHLPEQFRSDTNHWSTHHEVGITPDSKLFRAVGSSSIPEVSSYHHQAVDQLGKDLQVAARSPDGLVEAIEYTQARWVVGVQWHPEDLLESTATRRLFAAFVSACSESLR